MTDVMLTLATALLAMIGAGVRRYIQTKLTPARLGTALEFARTVVAAAEKVGRAVDDVTGADKYEYASGALKVLAKRVGLKLSDTEVHTLIHAVLNEADEISDALRRQEDAFADAA